MRQFLKKTYANLCDNFMKNRPTTTNTSKASSRVYNIFPLIFGLSKQFELVTPANFNI